MIHKTFVNDGAVHMARITFTLPATFWVDRINLVGDFNDWNPTSHPLHCTRSGEWTLTLDLQVNRSYRFRYLLDGKQWTSDSQADTYEHTPTHGSTFVVLTAPDRPRAA